MGPPQKPRAPLEPELPAQEEITKLKADAAALRSELEEARRSNQQYLQNVAHQLTAPLGAIKLSIEALRDAGIPIQRKSNLLSSIYSQGTILIHLIKNFALMSNLEADLELGQFRDRPEPVDALRLAINLANDFQPQAAERQVGIAVDDASFKKALGDKKIRMVKNLIAQALSNLLENAVKYSDFRSTIVMAAARVDVAPLPVSLVISVTSTGLPIKSEETKHLFERGFRGSMAKQKVPAGTGIGLYLANRVMTLHHGALGVKSNGKESQFRLVFPLSSLA